VSDSSLRRRRSVGLGNVEHQTLSASDSTTLYGPPSGRVRLNLLPSRMSKIATLRSWSASGPAGARFLVDLDRGDASLVAHPRPSDGDRELVSQRAFAFGALRSVSQRSKTLFADAGTDVRFRKSRRKARRKTGGARCRQNMIEPVT
jgi:hypothetical protein